MFIVFEGADGAGKSTQSKALVEALKAQNPDREVIWTREPGGTQGAEEIRELLKTGDANRWSAETELLLFNAARRDHVEKVITPAIERGAIVVCDRFVGSTIAYQGVRGPELAARAKRVHDEMIGIMPDLTFLLDRPMGDASVEARGLDRMEEAQAAFMGKTRAQFSALMNHDQSWVGIFAADKDLIAQTVLSVATHALAGDRPKNRVFMDEEYLANMPAFSEDVRGFRHHATLLDPEKSVEFLHFGDRGDEGQNPFKFTVGITADVIKGDLTVRSVGLMVGQTKAGFIGLSEERAETRIWERIEADLPELMAKYAGSELDFDVNSPA